MLQFPSPTPSLPYNIQKPTQYGHNQQVLIIKVSRDQDVMYLDHSNHIVNF